MEPTCKTCTKCGLTLPLSQFFKRAKGKYGRHSYCKPCKRQGELEDWIGRILKSPKLSARPKKDGERSRRLIRCTLTREWVMSQYDDQAGVCFYSGVRLRTGPKDNELFFPSIDRLDCDEHHDPHNCVLALRFINMGRRDSSIERVLEVLQELRIATPDDIRNAPIHRVRRTLPSVRGVLVARERWPEEDGNPSSGRRGRQKALPPELVNPVQQLSFGFAQRPEGDWPP
jgi:hypothetical protein